MQFPLAPLWFCRSLLGRCYIEKRKRLECYRYSKYLQRLVAYQKSNGSWYIRRKYRLFYSERFLRKLATKKNFL